MCICVKTLSIESVKTTFMEKESTVVIGKNKAVFQYQSVDVFNFVFESVTLVSMT